MAVVAQIIGGSFGKVIARKKGSVHIELGDLLVHESDSGKILFQVYDISYGSQLSQQTMELISGMKLEEDTDLELFDPHLRTYTTLLLKNILSLQEQKASLSKSLPLTFSTLREVSKDDLAMLTRPANALPLGSLRSGSKSIDLEISLDGRKTLSHHILIPAQTGKGKSNLTSCILWNCLDKDYCGMLVLDPHDEYYGRTGIGLKEHPLSKEHLVYYSPHNAPSGQRTLKINLELIRPAHFQGAVSWSDAQHDALNYFYRKYGSRWIESIMTFEDEEQDASQKRPFFLGTILVIKRRLQSLLDIDVRDGRIYCNGIFDTDSGSTTVKDILNDLEKSKTVIIDTSSFSGSVEILIGSLVATELFERYRSFKLAGNLHGKPVISIVLEEAPRVLGSDVLEQGTNIFKTIAREGRKFQIGLTAITQLPSLIPRDILANLSTKIILGIEMAHERQAVIDSAAQDLSDDSKAIASLDVGEARSEE